MKTLDYIRKRIDEDPNWQPCRMYFEQDEIPDNHVVFLCENMYTDYLCPYYESCPQYSPCSNLDLTYQAQYAYACGYKD